METSERLQRYTAATAVAALVLIAAGGAVRATDSGLACPTWPGCFYAGDFIPPADLHVWLEHSHRLIAGVVGLLVAGLVGWVLVRLRHRPRLVAASIAALVLVLVQSALGAVVVLRLLRAELVTAHLGMAMIVLALLLYVAVGVARPAGMRAVSTPLTRVGAAVAALCYVQILAGGHLTGVGGGLAFTDFPLMGGALVPEITTAKEAYHVLHRVLGVVLAVAVGYLVLRARRQQPADSRVARLAWIAAVLVGVQVALGAANLWTRTSFVTVIPHLAVASWLWATLVLFTLLSRQPAPEQQR